MKRFLITFIFFITFIFTGASVLAEGNQLHTITLEKNDSGYNVILGSDKITKVTKKSPNSNELILKINGITSSESVNALYKGTNNIEGLVIENTAPNKLTVHITADNISDSTVMIEPINGKPAIVGESVPIDKILWGVFVIALIGVIAKLAKDITEEEDKITIKKDIKDREIQMYRTYRSNLASSPINSTYSDMRMKKILKKIDRKIDERLVASINK